MCCNGGYAPRPITSACYASTVPTLIHRSARQSMQLLSPVPSSSCLGKTIIQLPGPSSCPGDGHRSSMPSSASSSSVPLPASRIRPPNIFSSHFLLTPGAPEVQHPHAKRSRCLGWETQIVALGTICSSMSVKPSTASLTVPLPASRVSRVSPSPRRSFRLRRTGSFASGLSTLCVWPSAGPGRPGQADGGH